MRPEQLARLAPQPPSEVEWEDLLLRLEIVPRVVRNTLEDCRPDDAAPAEPLREMVRNELRVGRWLEALAVGAPPPPLVGPVDEPEGDLESLTRRFASLRARTFAMLQRRGLEVWRWQGEVGEGHRATVYQVLCWLVASDAQRLVALREAARC